MEEDNPFSNVNFEHSTIDFSDEDYSPPSKVSKPRKSRSKKIKHDHPDTSLDLKLFKLLSKVKLNHIYTYEEMYALLPGSPMEIVQLNFILRSPDFKKRYCGEEPVLVGPDADPNVLQYNILCKNAALHQLEYEIDEKNKRVSEYKLEKEKLDAEYEFRLKNLKMNCAENKHKLNIAKEHHRIKSEGLHDKLECLRCFMLSYENTLRYVLRICFHFI
jgi:hypothetical protein